jgi:multicomponent K+:H+ antiporter subunit D
VIHLPLLPVLVPLAAALLQLALHRSGIGLMRVIGLASAGALLLLAGTLLSATADGAVHAVAVGDWPAPFGIVFVADRLAATMVAVTAVVALPALLAAAGGTDRLGRHFHPFFQIQLAGLNGAFLTGDLFNLFVFFEVLLIASYALLAHGAGPARIRAALHYVVLNLAGSLLFLLGLGLLYGTLGTLNIADLAGRLAVGAAGGSGAGAHGLRAASRRLRLQGGAAAARLLAAARLWGRDGPGRGALRRAHQGRHLRDPAPVHRRCFPPPTGRRGCSRPG